MSNGSPQIESAEKILGVVQKALDSIPLQSLSNARLFQQAVARALERHGFSVYWEVPVDLADGRLGYIDLVAHGIGSRRVAIELDNASPRRKSIEKLRKVRGIHVVVLRRHSEAAVAADRIRAATREIDAVLIPSQAKSSR